MCATELGQSRPRREYFTATKKAYAKTKPHTRGLRTDDTEANKPPPARCLAIKEAPERVYRSRNVMRPLVKS
jgi:hypothetical protein